MNRPHVDEVRDAFLGVIQLAVPEFWTELDRVRRGEMSFQKWTQSFSVADDWLVVVAEDTVRAWQTKPPHFEAQGSWFSTPVMLAPFTPDSLVFDYGRETLGEFARRARDAFEAQLQAWIRQKRAMGFGLLERDNFTRSRDAIATAWYQFRRMSYPEIVQSPGRAYKDEQACRKGVTRFAARIGLTLRRPDKNFEISVRDKLNCTAAQQ